jgi:hypothetical protein
MLTLEILYAVLQGLDPSLLTHLDTTWAVFCYRIHHSLTTGQDPLTAFKNAVLQTRPPDYAALRKMMREARPVMRLPGLSRRQKETLVALRYSKVASLSHLSQVLMLDRSNTFRTLKALVAKGLALKFFGKDGVYYYAVPAPLEKSVRVEINRLLLDQLDLLPPAQPEVTQPAILTTLTTATTMTIPTMAQDLTTVTT